MGHPSRPFCSAVVAELFDVTRADLDKQPHEVAEMFDGVAERYDLTNTVLSFGQDRGWRRATRAALEPAPGGAGPGRGRRYGRLDRGAAPLGMRSRSAPTCRSACCVAGRRAGRTVPLLAGDALRLPFADGTFDAVTISFALRNVVDTDGALRELGRVTRPGGRLVVCEFSHPTNAAFRTVYLSYLMRSLPAVARAVSSNPEAYVYLAESIRAWPDQPGLAARIGEAGPWARVGWRNLTGGVVALHRATRL